MFIHTGLQALGNEGGKGDQQDFGRSYLDLWPREEHPELQTQLSPQLQLKLQGFLSGISWRFCTRMPFWKELFLLLL